ncbi:MAG: hypothetical protein KDD64_05970 [Bdellovibrionales bacterium]|nr:hypothetical protein [Bdellovibrionales bacterium]
MKSFGVIAVALFLVALRFYDTVFFEPATLDAVRWIAKSSFDNPDLWEWIGKTNHFRVGYRPVTALVFLFSDLFSERVLVLRLIALSLCVGTIVVSAFLIKALLKESFGESSSILDSLCVVFLLGLHPVLDEIVPFLARLNYLLSGFFGVSALFLLVTSLDGKSERSAFWLLVRGLGGALLFVLSFLSNEAGITFVCAGFLFLIAARGWKVRTIRERAMIFLPSVVFVVWAIGIRQAVIGGVGGYGEGGIVLGKISLILSRLGHSLLNTRDAWWSEWLAALSGLLLIAVPFAIWTQKPSRASRDGRAFALWFLSVCCLFSIFGVWFPRQLFFVVIPFALLLVSMWRISSDVNRTFRIAVRVFLVAIVGLSYREVLLGYPSRVSFVTRASAFSKGVKDFRKGLESSSREAEIVPVLWWCESERSELSVPKQESLSSFPRAARAPYEWLQYLSRRKGRKLAFAQYVECGRDLSARDFIVEEGRILLVGGPVRKMMTLNRLKVYPEGAPLLEQRAEGSESSLIFVQTGAGWKWIDSSSLH